MLGRLRKLQGKAQPVEGTACVSPVRQGIEVILCNFITVKQLDLSLLCLVQCNIFAFEHVNGLLQVMRRPRAGFRKLVVGAAYPLYTFGLSLGDQGQPW